MNPAPLVTIALAEYEELRLLKARLIFQGSRMDHQRPGPMDRNAHKFQFSISVDENDLRLYNGAVGRQVVDGAVKKIVEELVTRGSLLEEIK